MAGVLLISLLGFSAFCLILLNGYLFAPTCESERTQLESLEDEIEHLKHAVAQSMNSKGGTELDSIALTPVAFRSLLVKSLQTEVQHLKSQNAVLRGRLGEGAVASVASALDEPALKSLAASGATAVVVIACKRPRYLEKSMASILGSERFPERFPLIISQDGDDAPTAQLIDELYLKPGLAFAIKHAHESNADAVANSYGGKAQLGYVYIAQHYGFAARTVFDNFGFQQVIFLEEDMEISPDFFSYFDAMLPILRSDPDLFCVSAWNDNGERDHVADTKALFRTDFFPGLGWMMNRDFWDEIRTHFPNAYWDEFMRRPDVRKGRHCIRPEVSRSFTFGSQGTSSGMFYGQHLSKIILNSDVVDWASENLAYLQSAEAFDSHMLRILSEAKLVKLEQVDRYDNRGLTLKVQYVDSEYAAVAKKFGLMADEKEGIRRMSYRGVIPFAWRRNRIYLFTQTWPR